MGSYFRSATEKLKQSCKKKRGKKLSKSAVDRYVYSCIVRDSRNKRSLKLYTTFFSLVKKKGNLYTVDNEYTGIKIMKHLNHLLIHHEWNIYVENVIYIVLIGIIAENKMKLSIAGFQIIPKINNVWASFGLNDRWVPGGSPHRPQLGHHWIFGQSVVLSVGLISRNVRTCQWH